MTAQVAIMNKDGVALATDSAVTTRLGKRDKVFTSANNFFPCRNVIRSR